MDGHSLATWIKDRRGELRLSMQKAADLADVHRLTWRGWENGSTPEDYNYAGIERALQWTRGSVAAILTGGRPKELEPDQSMSPAERAQAAIARYEAEVDRGRAEQALPVLTATLAEIEADVQHAREAERRGSRGA